MEMFKVNDGLSVKLSSGNFCFLQTHHNFRQQSNTKLKVDHCNTENYGYLYHSSDPKFGIPFWKKLKTLQLWQHSKLRFKVGNLSVHYIFISPNRHLFIRCCFFYVGTCWHFPKIYIFPVKIKQVDDHYLVFWQN